MKGMKGKLLKKVKSMKPVGYLKMESQVLQVSDSNRFVLNSWMSNFGDRIENKLVCGEKAEQEPDGTSSRGDFNDKENNGPSMEKKRSSFLVSKEETSGREKRELREIEINVSSFRKPDLKEKENAEPAMEAEVSGRAESEFGVSEIDVSSFRKPDMNSNSLFDPNLLELFYRAVTEHFRLSEAERQSRIEEVNLQNIKEEEEEEEAEPPSKAPRIELNKGEESDDENLLEFEEKCLPRQNGIEEENLPNSKEEEEDEEPPLKAPRIEQANLQNPKEEEEEEEGEKPPSISLRIEHNEEEEIDDADQRKSIGEEDLPSKAPRIEHNEEEEELSEKILPTKNRNREENLQNHREEEDPLLECSEKSMSRRNRIDDANPQEEEEEYPTLKAPQIEQTDEDDNDPLLEFAENCPPGGSESVILYTTTLRGIRKTFEGCRSLRFLLESFRILYSERDVSMHAGYRDELRRALGGAAVPPKLFVKGRFIGGAEEVLGLHERGELLPLFNGVPADVSDCPCEGCGGVRFVMCFGCHGSCKVIGEDEQRSVCLKCNENGLILCPLCC